ncbi:uncharacterized protein LOC111322844 [Stylophora pistillata]|uniref:uncharacterized protein LOC111322844 n=1 Tax=Stylophora pistillata TaxID=50429 RepID=UPI000C04699B|nr:uncharacterized protein LOC111322844 [Stylophora pistillata]XP_022781779.1 uncharacterized protein LOC111322844 [Stylophora pistillata]
MDRCGSIPHTIKRKCSDISNDVGHTGKKTRLQVTIPKLKLSEQQLQGLKKLTTKLQRASVNKECGIPSSITGVANTSTMEEVADLAPSTAQTVRRKETITEKESPVRHSLSDLLSGSSVISHIETYPDCEEIDVERNVCEVPTGKSCLNRKSPKACLFYSDEPLPSENGGSPSLWNKDCITVPCYPDVVSETCQQVAEDFGKTSWNYNGQEAGLKTANTEQDESGCCKENQQLQSGNNKDIFSDDYKDEPESLSANHYQSIVEVMNSLLTSFAEEKEAKAQLEEKNQELYSECERLKKLVKDFQLTSTAKAETVSRGIQINMDLSLRRGRAVDRATSPVGIRGPSPDVTLLSYSIGCQASPEEVAPPKKMTSSFCQTDPEVMLGLPPRSSTENAVATRVQGIVMPSIQGRAPVEPLVSNPKPPNPFQVAYNSPILCQPGTGMNVPQVDFHPPPFTQGQRSSDLMSKQLYTTSLDTRYPVNIAQTSGSNTVGYQISNYNAAGYHSRVPNAVDSNSTPPQLFESHQYTSKSIYDKHAQQIATNLCSNVPGPVPQQVRLSHFPDQSFTSLNQMLPYTKQILPTFRDTFPGEQQWSNQAGNVRPNATFPNTEIMTPNHQVTARRNSVSINQTHNGNASSSSSPAQNIGTQQHSALRQTAPMHLSQLFRHSPCYVQTSAQRYNSEMRLLITRQASKECVQLSRRCEQPLSSPHGFSQGSNVQTAIPQHVEGVPSQHRRIEAYEGQTCTRLNNPPATERVPVMSKWTAKGKEQIKPNLSSSPASNSFNISQGTSVDGTLAQRAPSHIQTSNPYGEVQVQRVYSESQGTSSNDKQPVNVVNEPNTYLTQLPSVSQQSQLMVSRSNHVVSMSEQRSVPHETTTANTLPHDATNRLESSQTSTHVTYSDRNLIGGTVERTVLFSHEKVSGSVV